MRELKALAVVGENDGVVAHDIAAPEGVADVAAHHPAVPMHAAALDREFLTEAGWDPASRVLSMPAGHPLLD